MGLLALLFVVLISMVSASLFRCRALTIKAKIATLRYSSSPQHHATTLALHPSRGHSRQNIPPLPLYDREMVLFSCESARKEMVPRFVLVLVVVVVLVQLQLQLQRFSPSISVNAGPQTSASFKALQ